MELYDNEVEITNGEITGVTSEEQWEQIDSIQKGGTGSVLKFNVIVNRDHPYDLEVGKEYFTEYMRGEAFSASSNKLQWTLRSPEGK